MKYDCAIIGGGPAGLSAALVLGRARRDVILLDNSKPRNRVTKASHGFLTRDGVSPIKMRELAHEELSRYPSVVRQNGQVERIAREETGFVIGTTEGRSFHARKLLLASGLTETMPNIPGLMDFYGTSVFNCPYCDGWERRDKPIVQISEGEDAFKFAILLYNWSKDLIVCTNGKESLSPDQQQMLQAKGIAVITQPIVKLCGKEGKLTGVVFADGTGIERGTGFVTPLLSLSTSFGEQFGCRLTGLGGLETDEFGRTSVPGVYAAGDTSAVVPSQLIIAAGEGSRAAIGINTDLSMEAFR